MRRTRELETMIRQAYRLERPLSSATERRAVADAMMREATLYRTEDRRDTLSSFIASQVRFIGWRAWLAQAAVIILMGMICASQSGNGTLAAAASLLAAASVAIGLPWLFASKTYGMSELERSCLLGGGSVALARLLILGIASALAMTGIVIVVPVLSHLDPVLIAMRAAAPYFLSYAGALAIGAHADRTDAVLASVTWITLVAAASCAIYAAVPAAYDTVSTWVWSIASGVGATWTLLEALSWIRACELEITTLPKQIHLRAIEG